MVNKELLLSICIPTYNGGASFLDSVLRHTISLAELYPDEVEVIVSDNSSTDNTSDIISSLKKHSCLRTYRNETNVGFKGNLLLLTDKYSQGKFSWIIGDDDFIMPSALPLIIEKLKEDCCDFISIGSEIIHLPELNKTLNKTRTYTFIQGSYAHVIDQNCYEGNVLASFMGGAIFRTSKFREFPKNFITNSFNDFRNVFPNGYIYASVFYNSSCGCISQISIISVSRDKSWSTSDNVYLIFSKYLPDLYKYIVNKGYKNSDLKKTYNVLLYKTTMITLIRIKQREQVKGLLELFVKLLCRPSVFFRVIKSL